MQETVQASNVLPVTPEPQKLTIDQVKQLVKDFERELHRVQVSLKAAQDRVRRQDDLTNRSKFSKKDLNKVSRSLRRYQDAQEDVNRRLQSENNIKAQIEHFRGQLTAAGF